MEGGVVVVDRAVRILQAIAGEDANHGRSRWDLILSLQQTGDGSCTGGFAEDAFLATQELVGLDDFCIRHIQESAVAGLTGGDGFGSVHRIADADGRCNGVRIAHGGVVDQRGGTAGLEPHHSRKGAAVTGLLVFLEAHPIGGDVAGIAHGNAEPVRSITEGIDDFESSCFLALQSVGVHRVDQRHGVFLRGFADDVQSAVEIAADGQNLSAIDEGLSQFSLGDVTVWNQDEGPHAATTGIGRGRGTGVAGAGADHGFTAGFLGLADGHGHPSILEGSGGIEAVVFDVHLHSFADPFLDRRHRDQRGCSFPEGDHRSGGGHR